LFLFINVSLANPVFDFVMPLVTDSWFVRGVFLLILIGLATLGGKKGRMTAVLCIITVALSDQLSAHLIKSLVGRIRPCHVLPNVNLLVDCSAGLAFPSAHAANTFAQAALLSQRHPGLTWLWFGFASLVSFSRIVVGVHYPGDVLGGGLLGIAVGLAVVGLHRIVAARYEDRRKREH
ncbi:MAG: phosphatase PAP2 family protein, partial [bacterium]